MISNDQAESLRRKLQTSPQKVQSTRVITITSGKGGVGKSNFTLNFALALLDHNHKTTILDADIGLANIDVLMGVHSRYTLQDLLEQRLGIWEIIEKGPKGLNFIAGGSDLELFISQQNQQNVSYLFEQFQLLNGHVDTLLVDTGAGISPESLKFMLSSDEVFLVTTPEPTAITDAYAIIKMIHSREKTKKVSLIINRSSDEKEALSTANRIRIVSKNFLDFDIHYLGYITNDEHVSKAVKRQEPFYLSYPNSKASKNIRTIVEKYIQKQEPYPIGGTKAFLEKMYSLFRR
ncbi:MinD/ParA family protein [Tepidibacillus fermentans]|uniref:Flagellar biosynthesis protein FlhG n=1 Tax=Tepidibacillus fermentans TaxID=1281767 RepID=A0A4R3KHK9_9BACI|nr:MinD/ParA family protein [Tepidibacillus fermentans]TCS82957.1 flagellar biosynthesis protein FlhG [Tepidibacillus fermentans]